jgi:hypothetical protein
MKNSTYTSEKFAIARRSLMLPHPDGEITSIVDAFNECSHGLHEINADDLDDEARESLNKLEELMDTTGLSDPSLGGLHTIKAELLTLDQKAELSREIDYLASWFDARSRE